MSKLHDYQNLLSAYVLAAPGAPAPVALVDSAHNQATAAARFGIYKNNVYAHLIEALEASFPVVRRLVGDEFFRFAARSYIPRHPPRSGTLLDFGGSFVEFLEGFEPAASVPYLSDVARLEQLYLRAYHAPEIFPPKGGHFTQPSLADRKFMRLRLHPSAGLMTSPYQVSRIWELNLRDEDLKETELSPEFEYLLVIRPRTQVEVRRLSPGAFAMVRAIELGDTLDKAMAAGCSVDEKFESGRHLQALIAGETFTAFQETTVGLERGQ
jgi:hypothetical protein